MATICIRTCVAVAAVAAVTTAFLAAPAAEARRGGGIAAGIAAGVIGGMILNEAARAMNNQNRSSGSRSRSGGGSSSSDDSDDDDDETTASSPIRAGTGQSNSINAAAEEQKLRLIRANEEAERKRNVDKAVEQFILRLEALHKDLRGENANVRVGQQSAINQVTAGEVRRLVEDAYFKDSQLVQFDRFAGELWTRDRLMVALIEEAKKGLQPYFVGVGARGPSIVDLTQVFKAAAGEVYARAVELSEIVGVANSFDRFVRSISENSDRVPASLLTIGADGEYEGLLTRALNSDADGGRYVANGPVPVADPVGLNRHFQFRYRARRTLYDCIAANYVEIATGVPQKQGTIEIGVVRIDTLQIGGPATRGATLSSGPQARPEPAAATTMGGMPVLGAVTSKQELWQRITDHVRAKCFEPVTMLKEVAKRDGLAPQPARSDMNQMLGSGQTGVLPIGNITIQPAPTR